MFFDASRPVLILAPIVLIFDPTKKNSFLSTESLPRGPIPKSIPQHYRGNIYRGLRQSPFPYILKGGAPANARFLHPSGSWAHPAKAHPVLLAAIYKVLRDVFPHRKER